MNQADAETVPTKVYMLGVIPYVPHYRNPGIFVAPGGTLEPVGDSGRTLFQPNNMKSEAELIALGATRSMMMLWPRPK